MYKKLIVLLPLLMYAPLKAQKISYPELFHRAQSPAIFIDDLIVPDNNGNAELIFTFKFSNSFLPFRKIPVAQTTQASGEFYSTITLNAEIFEGLAPQRAATSIKTVTRGFWADTLYALSFDETQNRNQFANGAFSVKLQPGDYHYILQLSLMQESQERNTQRQNITIPDFNTKKTGEIYLAGNVDISAETPVAELLNMADYVPYGNNFNTLIRIPEFDDSAEYEIVLQQAQIAGKDTLTGKHIATLPIPESSIYGNAIPQLITYGNPKLALAEGKYTYALLEIPNQNLENAVYLMSLKKQGGDEVLARRVFRSYWPEMPASLYNLNVAIDMLKFIISDAEIRQIRSGDAEARMRNFREFWKSKDPTPNTEFNELMAEYYRRIDYAYKEFSSPEKPLGHENDQGKVYIKFGPPVKKERQYPPGQKTREVWTYPNRTFIFEASTGFGDFILIGTN